MSSLSAHQHSWSLSWIPKPERIGQVIHWAATQTHTAFWTPTSDSKDAQKWQGPAVWAQEKALSEASPFDSRDS